MSSVNIGYNKGFFFLCSEREKTAKSWTQFSMPIHVNKTLKPTEYNAREFPLIYSTNIR